MKYRFFDHTADFGIQAFGAELTELFANAAAALFDLITDTGQLNGTEKLEIHVEGDDLPDLMVNWLRELLYLWNGKGYLVKDTSVVFLSEYRLVGTVRYDPYNPVVHQIENEIKAVTYHRIQVSRTPSGWEAIMIVDV